LLSLDRDHHDRLRAILERCCEMSTEYISGQGGLFQVLTADEMLESDVAAARDDRRTTEGFVSPADARAFLELARRGEAGDARDAITRAYFRRFEAAKVSQSAPRSAPERDAPVAPAADVGDLAALLREAEVIAPPSAQLLLQPRASQPEPAHLAAPLFEQAMATLRKSDPARFAERVRELGYLVNVWIAGGAHEGRRPRPTEALEIVLRTCEAGMGALAPERALAILAETPVDLLFRRGFRR